MLNNHRQTILSLPFVFECRACDLQIQELGCKRSGVRLQNAFDLAGIEGELLLVFKYLNPRAHDQEFTVGVRVLKDRQYEGESHHIEPGHVAWIPLS